MTVRLKNLRHSGPLHVPLSSGKFLRLSPQQVASDIADSDVADNPKLTRLVAEGALLIEPSGGAAPRRRGKSDNDTRKSGATPPKD